MTIQVKDRALNGGVIATYTSDIQPEKGSRVISTFDFVRDNTPALINETVTPKTFEIWTDRITPSISIAGNDHEAGTDGDPYYHVFNVANLEAPNTPLAFSATITEPSGDLDLEVLILSPTQVAIKADEVEQGTFDMTLKVTNKYFFAVKQYQLIVI